MPNPEGYRKALRLMKQAEKFGRPILLFVDTPGAFCGVEAEERGQGEAIARNLFELAGLTVPVLSIIIGEGGSGGALGACDGERGVDARKFRLFDPFPGRLCGNPLEEWKALGRSRGSDEVDGCGTEKTWSN